VLNSPSNHSDPTGQFPPSFHGDQTFRIARDVFGPKCENIARIVANADASMDSTWGQVNFFGSAWQYGGPHFPKPGQADGLVNAAIGACSATSLGKALHTVQDGYAHPRGRSGPFLHWILLSAPDAPGGAEGGAAAGATRAILQDFKDKCLPCCTGGSSTQLVAQ
jgi:hypothetical protein